jgi:hypothetical protein
MQEQNPENVDDLPEVEVPEALKPLEKDPDILISGAERNNLGVDGKFMEPGEVVGEDGESPLLVAMKRVMSQHGSEDKTYWEKEARKWLRADKVGFMRKLADMTTRTSRSRGASGDGGPAAAKVDEGTVKVTGLIDRILSEYSEINP